MRTRSRAPRISRRLACALALSSLPAFALGRTPYGGVLRAVIPWGLERLDPHAFDDPIAALFGAAIADPLYALDTLGRPYPALADGLPRPSQPGAEVRLRPGLVSAAGKPLDARDVVASMTRARRRGALLPEARLLPGPDRLGVSFPASSPETLAAELASPLAAVLPRSFSPLEPDGTGAFRATLARGRLVLARNDRAARGPAFLGSIEVSTVRDLSEALRAFESGAADLGWLGAGLHRPRPDARPFRGMAYGFSILRTGKRAGAWGAPGIAQRLLDAIAPEQLRHLGLEGLAAPSSTAIGWGGGSAPLLVADDAPQLELIARALAALLGRPGHELSVERTPKSELSARRASRDYTLMVDFVRTLGTGRNRTEQTFLLAENPELAKNPSGRFGNDARAVCRTLPLGVIGELWVTGAHAASFQNLSGFQLGNVSRAEPAP